MLLHNPLQFVSYGSDFARCLVRKLKIIFLMILK